MSDEQEPAWVTKARAQQFVGLYVLSRFTGLSVTYLKAEAEAGRLPHIVASRSMRFDHRQVAAFLASAAMTNMLHTSQEAAIMEEPIDDFDVG